MPALSVFAALGLALSLALVVGIAAGIVLPAGFGPASAAITAAGLAVIVAVIRARPAILVIAAFAVGLARGWGASQGSVEPIAVIPRGLLLAEVLGGSTPGPRCRVDVRGVSGAGRWRLHGPPEGCPLAAGDRLWIRAEEVAAAGVAARMPWRRAGGGRSGLPELSITRSWPAGRGPGGYLRWVAERRQGAWEASRGDPERSLVVASVLGMPSALPPAGRGALRDAGLGHILAVSGLHVAIAAMALQGALRRLLAAFGRSSPGLGLLGLAPVVAYVVLTGAAPSAVRAAGMLALWTLGAALGRPAHGPTILALTAATVLLIEPRWAVDPGFQLSMAAMAALVHPRAPRGLFAQSWRVTWTTLPVSLWHFGGGSLVGALLNLAAIPVFCGWVLPAGALGVLLLPAFGGGALDPAAVGAGLLLDLAALGERVPRLPEVALAALGVGLWALGRIGLRGGGGGRFWPLERKRAERGMGEDAPVEGPTRSGWARLAPPTWAVVAVVVVVLARGRAASGESAGEIGWRAIGGGGPALTLVAQAIDDEGAARGVCLADPWLSPGEIVALLEALGRPSVRRISGGSPHEAAALRAALERAGLAGIDASEEIACAWPALDRRALRRALRRCRALGGGPRSMIGGGPGAGIRCRIGPTWRELG